MKKLFFAILLIGTLSACATDDAIKAGYTDFDSKGNVVRVVDQVVSAKEYERLQSVRAAETSNQAFYAAQGKMYENVSDGRDVALIQAIQALSGAKNPTNYNDTLIAESQASVEKTKAYTGIVGSAFRTVLGYQGIKSIADLGEAALNRAGNSTIVDNGSTYQGAQGEGASYTEQISGIQVQPVETDRVTLGSDPEEEEITNAEECIAAGGDPVFGDDGEFERCSDGSGGTL